MTNIKIKKNIRMSELTTFQLGGPCKGLIECSRVEELIQSVSFLMDKHYDFVVIGEGSNILASDQGIDKMVIRYLTEEPLVFQKGNHLEVSGSTKLDDLVSFAVEHGLAGLTFASGIPGTVAGAIVGNAGAFGEQISDVLQEVRILTSDGEKKNIKKECLDFSYRYSCLKENNDVILSALFILSPSIKNVLMHDRRKKLSQRKEKHPDYKSIPCAGSFFKNVASQDNDPRRKAAGWFLEQVGAKDLKVGGAGVFEKHANIIVKWNNDCTTENVIELSRRMQTLVKERFDIALDREVQMM